MVQDNQPDTRAGRIGFLIYGIARGAAVAVLALALYAAFTNWGGGGSFWGMVYAVIALGILVVGTVLRMLLSGR